MLASRLTRSVGVGRLLPAPVGAGEFDERIYYVLFSAGKPLPASASLPLVEGTKRN